MNKKNNIQKCDNDEVTFKLRCICRFLRNTRIEKGLTQQQIADASNLSKQMISKIECCEVNPSLTTIIKYCMCLEIDLYSAIKNEYDWEEELDE